MINAILHFVLFVPSVAMFGFILCALFSINKK